MQRRMRWAILLFLGILAAVTVFGMVQLEGQIAIHFDVSGQPDAFMHVVPGLLVLPLVTALALLFFHYLPRIDPLGDNYESFSDLFSLLKVLITGIMTYIQGLIVLWNMGYTYDPVLMLVPVIVSAYFLAGRIMEEADRNWFIGIRTPWTLSSDAVWDRTHETVAPLMKLAAAIAVLPIFFPRYGVYFFALPAFLIAVFSFVYSYWIYTEED
ncbi:MAG: SdpI family protein [Candidatus Nanohaloarchaea archaeon]|nr:SdpI family protein [Candidatus Nanohaloarchaea archaeon]